MKKLKSSATNMALVLTLISVLAAGLLAYVNSITCETIDELKVQRETEAIAKVLGGGEVVINDTIVVAAREGSSDSIYVYLTDKGVAVKTVDPANKSFGGGLTVMVGFDTEGKILGYEIVESNETPGLGAKADTWFQEGNKGCIIGINPAGNELRVRKDGGEIDAITASTITSRSFLSAVNAAYREAMSVIPANADEEESVDEAVETIDEEDVVVCSDTSDDAEIEIENN